MTEQHFELIVAGGGYAGCAAALAAARDGCRVLLIEDGGALGGAAVNCLVNPFMDWFTTIEKNGKRERLSLSAGIFEEIRARMAALGGSKSHIFHEEYLKIALDRMLAEAGVTVLFHSRICQAAVEGGKLVSISCANISGLQEYSADYWIDCTGDASLAMLSGCPFRLGREEDSLCQPMTLCFRMVNVDTEHIDRSDIDRLYQQAQKEGRIRNPREDVLMFNTLVPGMIHFNSTRIVKLNPTDPADVSNAEALAREQMMELIDFLCTEVSAFKNARLVSSASHIGVRESRMINGQYLLTENDLKNCTRFDDAIAAGNYDIDIHNPEGTGTSHYYFKPGEYYTIPYRSLVPQCISNLLVAGRCISVTHAAQASIRIMPIVCTLGEAAGTAAAQARRKHLSSMQDVDIRNLQNTLVHNGAFIGISFK